MSSSQVDRKYEKLNSKLQEIPLDVVKFHIFRFYELDTSDYMRRVVEKIKNVKQLLKKKVIPEKMDLELFGSFPGAYRDVEFLFPSLHISEDYLLFLHYYNEYSSIASKIKKLPKFLSTLFKKENRPPPSMRHLFLVDFRQVVNLRISSKYRLLCEENQEPIRPFKNFKTIEGKVDFVFKWLLSINCPAVEKLVIERIAGFNVEFFREARFPRLRELCLKEVGVSFEDEIFTWELENFRNLQRLVLEDCDAKSYILRVLGKTKKDIQLVVRSIVRTQEISSTNWAPFHEELKNLTLLQLKGGQLNFEHLPKSLDNLNSVEFKEIILMYSGKRWDGFTGNLRHLTLEKVGGLEDEFFVCNQFPNLSTLKIINAYSLKFEEFPMMPKLTCLDIDTTYFCVDPMFVRFSFPKLENLSLFNCFFSDESKFLVENFSNLKTMKIVSNEDFTGILFEKMNFDFLETLELTHLSSLKLSHSKWKKFPRLCKLKIGLNRNVFLEDLFINEKNVFETIEHLEVIKLKSRIDVNDDPKKSCIYPNVKNVVLSFLSEDSLRKILSSNIFESAISLKLKNINAKTTTRVVTLKEELEVMDKDKIPKKEKRRSSKSKRRSRKNYKFSVLLQLPKLGEGIARVDFKKKLDEELPISGGDKLIIFEKCDEWIYCKKLVDSSEGFCPESFVDYEIQIEKVEKKKNPGDEELVEKKIAIAMFDFEKSDEEELSVKEGERVSLLVDQGEWLFVQNDEGEQGYAPSSYFEVSTEKDTVNLLETFEMFCKLRKEKRSPIVHEELYDSEEGESTVPKKKDSYPRVRVKFDFVNFDNDEFMIEGGKKLLNVCGGDILEVIREEKAELFCSKSISEEEKEEGYVLRKFVEFLDANGQKKKEQDANEPDVDVEKKLGDYPIPPNPSFEKNGCSTKDSTPLRIETHFRTPEPVMSLLSVKKGEKELGEKEKKFRWNPTLLNSIECLNFSYLWSDNQFNVIQKMKNIRILILKGETEYSQIKWDVGICHKLEKLCLINTGVEDSIFQENIFNHLCCLKLKYEFAIQGVKWNQMKDLSELTIKQCLHFNVDGFMNNVPFSSQTTQIHLINDDFSDVLTAERWTEVKTKYNLAIYYESD